MSVKQQHRHQQGFVLILVMVMLAVLTLIGVSSMNSSSMELKATANARQHQAAFHVVQSALEYAVSSGGAAVIDFQTNDTTLVQNITPVVANGTALSADVAFSGCGVSSGSSLEKGFSYNFYEIKASGANATGTANSIQTQGVRFPAASC